MFLQDKVAQASHNKIMTKNPETQQEMKMINIREKQKYTFSYLFPISFSYLFPDLLTIFS